MRKLRQKAYNTTAWRKLRDTYIKEHPLCEVCLGKGKVTPANHIHHLRSPFKGGTINQDLLLDVNNLQSICSTCHAEEHVKEQGHMTQQQAIELLDFLFNENSTDN